MRVEAENGATAAIQQNPYRAVLAWFLAKFPKYDEYKAFFADNGEVVEKPPGRRQL